MKKFLLAAAFALATTGAYAADSCSKQAADKKLAGAAKTSFMGKCEKEAAASCDLQAGEKKLAGAAKSSFTKKCVTEAVGG